MKFFRTLLILVSVSLIVPVGAQEEKSEDPKNRPLRIIAFGAHPDDPEFQIGGCAIKWEKLGHQVKLVSCTNGDIGHWEMSGGELAKRRTAEVEEAARRMGTDVEVLDIHDGELEQTLENRKTIVRLIREWDADLVFSHRPYDYHPDHRNVGLLVQDAAFMVMVPNFCPDTPALTKNPAFFFFPDNFTKPYPFTPTLAVSIDDVFEEKVQAIDALESQVYDGGALGNAETWKKRFGDDPKRRLNGLKNSWSNRHSRIANKHRDSLIEWYGEKKGNEVKHAEAFELCEYGSKPSKEKLKVLFPFFP